MYKFTNARDLRFTDAEYPVCAEFMHQRSTSEDNFDIALHRTIFCCIGTPLELYWAAPSGVTYPTDSVSRYARGSLSQPSYLKKVCLNHSHHLRVTRPMLVCWSEGSDDE